LFDETTGENLGANTSVLEGWTPWHLDPPAGYVSLNISQFRHGHILQLRQADGTTWNVRPAPGYESPESGEAYSNTPTTRARVSRLRT
jgi:hypothetical protein